MSVTDPRTTTYATSTSCLFVSAQSDSTRALWGIGVRIVGTSSMRYLWAGSPFIVGDGTVSIFRGWRFYPAIADIYLPLFTSPRFPVTTEQQSDSIPGSRRRPRRRRTKELQWFLPSCILRPSFCAATQQDFTGLNASMFDGNVKRCVASEFNDSYTIYI
mmetsp:Transcript_11345/g.21768  ORF Transcript_11345/g.21768 Transcript_11345/m.21768 type:complete len:160 (-) Transcript_11345:115-594(-)